MTDRRRSVRRLAGGAVAAAIVSLAFAGIPRLSAFAIMPGDPGVAATDNAGQAQAQPTQKAPKKDPAVKLAEPWPEAKQIAERRVESEKMPLFASADPLAITISADFNTINREREPNNTKRFPGTLQVQGEGGKPASIPVQLGSRGHARLNKRTCDLVPLRLEMTKKDAKGTVFEGQKDLKLVTNCQNDGDYEQYVLTEYLAYQVFNLFTPRSFRARLVKATYVDSVKNKASSARVGMLIENDDDVARRMEGRNYPLTNQAFRFLDQDTLMLMALLQFMVGNTDYSIVTLHNVKLVQDRAGKIYPVTYDFDYSGLVNARYAVPDKRLMLRSVTERLYRGPCRTAQELEPFIATFRAKKAELLALADKVPGMSGERRREAKDFLDESLGMMTNAGRAKRALIDPCIKALGM